MNPTEWLLEALDEAFDRPSWHGTNLRGSLRGVKPAEALWRPASGRHNIWEIVLHVTTWIDVVRRRLEGEILHEVPDTVDFPPVARADKASWNAARRRLNVVPASGNRR